MISDLGKNVAAPIIMYDTFLCYFLLVDTRRDQKIRDGIFFPPKAKIIVPSSSPHLSQILPWSVLVTVPPSDNRPKGKTCFATWKNWATDLFLVGGEGSAAGGFGGATRERGYVIHVRHVHFCCPLSSSRLGWWRVGYLLLVFPLFFLW